MVADKTEAQKGSDKPKMTPRDYTYNSTNTDGSLKRDFRLQGFAEKNFEKPRINLAASIETDTPTKSKSYGVRNWLDTTKPKGFSDGVQGLQYGSNGAAPPTTNGPRPIVNPLNKKTSAELEKYRHLQMEVEADIARFKKEKLEKISIRENEKREDLELLKRYHPWGKPGGGAPLSDRDGNNYRRHSQPSSVINYDPEIGNFHSNFGRPGAGAPLRTESGKVKAEMKTSSDIRFQDSQDGRQMYERYVRYKGGDEQKQHYSKDLQRQLQEKQLNNKELRIQELKTELEMIKHNPFGKPGAGAPNSRRGDDGQIHAGRKSSLSADVLEMRRIEQKERELGLGITNTSRASDPELAVYDPWGKGYGAPQRDQYGDVRRYKFSDRNYGVHTDSIEEPKMNSLPIDNGLGGAGAPVKSDNGEIMTRMPITMKRNERGVTSIREDGSLAHQKAASAQSDPELQVYDPWGRVGAGAPLRDQTGAIVTARPKREESGDVNQRALAKQVYLKELQRGMEEQRAVRDNMDRELKHGGGDLASVMRQGQVGRPRRDPDTGFLTSQHHHMSDVTKGKADVRSMKDENSHLYHTELENAAEERRRTRMLEKVKEQQESIHHQSTYDTFWGRPGAGAPLAGGVKKVSIDKHLQAPNDDSSAGDSWGRPGAGAPMSSQGYKKINLEKILNGSIQTSTQNEDYSFDHFFGRPGAGAPLAQGARKVNLDKILRACPELTDEAEHQSTFDTFWGKPGAGAPIDRGAKKAKLDNILHTPRNEPDCYYSKLLEQDAPPHNYIRSTIPSNHNNMFELVNPKRLDPQKPNYSLTTPWASSPEGVF